MYERTKLRFLDIANIHVVRGSYDALRVCPSIYIAVWVQVLFKDVVEVGSEQKWWSMVESTGWLGHIRSVLSGRRYTH